MPRGRTTLLITIVLALLLGAGCSGAGDSADDLRTESTTTATTATTEATPAIDMPGPGEPWDLLFIRQSWYHSDLVPQLYAELAAEALGVEIRLHDVPHDPRDASLVLAELRGVAHPPLGDLARQAEIIVVGGESELSGPNRTETTLDSEFQKCNSEESPLNPGPPVMPIDSEWQLYREVLDAIYAEIWSLREGTPTVLIASDVYNGGIVRFQRERGIVADCSAMFDAMNDVARKAAEENGATMASVFEVFNGPDGSLDPSELGYTGGSAIPRARTNEVGAKMVAEALAAAGFEPTTQP